MRRWRKLEQNKKAVSSCHNPNNTPSRCHYQDFQIATTITLVLATALATSQALTPAMILTLAQGLI